MRFRIEASVQECLGEDCPEEFLPVFHHDPVTYDEIPQQRQICSNMLNFLG